MKSSSIKSILLVALLSASAFAQFSGGTRCTVRVDVVYVNGNRIHSSLRVQLLGGVNNSPVAVAMTSSSGTAEFDNLGPGTYQVEVTGDAIQSARSPAFMVADGQAFESQTVAVRPKQEGGSEHAAPQAAVAAVDLNVPKEADKEFRRANKEMEAQNWKKAVDHLNKAISIYPKYSSAYNNLAVCYNHIGQLDLQRESLQKAISVNDRCVPALVNLGRLMLEAHNYAEAGSLLNKALAADPVNVEALTLLARVDFMEGHDEQVLADARKVHSLPHEGYAIVHYTAASALERQGHIQDAIAELEIFLKEEPDGPRADAVRKAVLQLQNEH